MEDHHYKLNKKAFLNYLLLTQPTHMWNWHVDAYFMKNKIKNIDQFPEAYDLVISVVDDPSVVASVYYSRGTVSLDQAKKTISSDTRGSTSTAAVNIVSITKRRITSTFQLKNTIKWAQGIIENHRQKPHLKCTAARLMGSNNFVNPKWSVDTIVNANADIPEENFLRNPNLISIKGHLYLSPLGNILDLFEKSVIRLPLYIDAKEKILNRNKYKENKENTMNANES